MELIQQLDILARLAVAALIALAWTAGVTTFVLTLALVASAILDRVEGTDR